MKRRLTILIPSILVLSGCAMSLTLPVQGDFNKGKERFLGQATGKLDGSGTMAMTTDTGIQCNGVFQYDEPRVSGSGTFNCQDGRKGTFNFTSNGNSGIGFGRTSIGEPFRFNFGHNQVVTTW